MCEATYRSGRSTAPGRPRWGLLYGSTVTILAGFVAVEAAHTSQAARVALRCALALALFATMSIWVRANRPAFDLQNWCDCAGEQMKIRVIESPGPLLVSRVVPTSEVEEQYEIATR